MFTPEDAVGAERDRRLTDDSLIEINRLWTVVRAFSNVAHELNNALQVVSGHGELLASGDLEPAARRRVEAIRAKAADAAAAVDRLLSYSRDDAATTGVTELGASLDAAVALRAATLARARIIVTVDKSVGEPCRVSTDRRRTLQMLLNLLLSAEETLRRGGGGQIHARYAVDATDAVVVIEARSSGLLGEREVPATEEGTLTAGAPLWVAWRLADAAHGRLETLPSGSLGVTLKLTLPLTRS